MAERDDRLCWNHEAEVVHRLMPVRHDEHEGGGYDELVGDGVEELAEARGLAPLARQIAIQGVGDAGDRK
jgi:hypothetical protein